jgi:diacylglycerol kinase family enzyme
MSQFYEMVALIYNPKSTGDAFSVTKALQKDLEKIKITNKVALFPTKYANHAEEIAKAIATKYKKPLIVSVSGDGGYHEVVNGVMASGNKNAVCTVEAAGNANDHWRVVHNSQPLIDRIQKSPRAISILKLSVQGPDSRQRFAHSYIGFGISAKVAHELNQKNLSRLKELNISAKSFLKLKSFKLFAYGDVRSFDSILAANISQMAKNIKINKDLDLESSSFNLILHHHRNKLSLIIRTLSAMIRPDKKTRRVTSFSCTTLGDVWVQLDGEPTKLSAENKVQITGIKNALLTI